MFGYKIIKESDLANLNEYKQSFLDYMDERQMYAKLRRETVKDLVEAKQRIIDLQLERIEEQQKVIDNITKDIPRWGWHLGYFDKSKKDSQLKKELPEGITMEQVEHIVIDRKQHKIAILLK